MSEVSFDPFDLPSTFDPLAPVAPAPPRRRRLVAVAAAESAPRSGGGAAGRLAHLLRPNSSEVAKPPSIEELQAQVLILTARLDRLETLLARQLVPRARRIAADPPSVTDTDHLKSRPTRKHR